MHLRIRLALLLLLSSAAAFAGAEAWRSLRPPEDEAVPQELYAPFAARAESAEYVLGDSGGYVAVFERGRNREPMAVTPIELSGLRTVDQAMLRQGLPVGSHRELLLLLEDLGS